MEEKTALYVRKLSEMINVETVSVFQKPTPEKYEAFQEKLRELFPRVFAAFTLELFHGSLLLSHPVENSREPILMMSHQDVVDPNGTWASDPFRAEVRDGRLYGRGTLDTKGNLFAILQALEELLEEGVPFTRGIYVESACNEETTQDGSREIFDVLRARGIHFYFTIDEGGMIIPNPFGGSGEPVAMVALGEKVPVDLKFSIRGAGGHASTPAPDQPLVVLSNFIREAAACRSFAVKLEPTNIAALQRVADTQKGILKLLFRRADLFAPLLTAVFKRLSPATNALVRTTVCFTRISGSNGNNVIPETAYVIANMRVSHREGIDSAIAKLKAIADKYGLETEIIDRGTPSGICSHETEQFRYLEQCVGTVFPGVKTCPYIANGASDSQNLEGLSDSIFRFAPFTISEAQLETVHGINENVDIAALAPAVSFFRTLVRGL